MESDTPLKESWSEMMDNNPQSPVDSPRDNQEDNDELDRLDAPVIWIRCIHGRSEETINALIMKSFKDHEVEGVEIVSTHYSHDENRDHAYILLNSNKHSTKLLEGIIPVVIPSESDDPEDEDHPLIFEEANHLEPRETQDANILYLYNLKFDMKPQEIGEYFEDLITSWSPIEGFQLQKDRYGDFNNALKVKMFCYEDTRKCIYLLNYKEIEGVVIRAGFCNIDRNVIGRYRPEKTDRVQAIKKKNSSKKNRGPLRNTPPKKKARDPQPNTKNIIKIQPGKGGWVEVPVKKKNSSKKNSK